MGWAAGTKWQSGVIQQFGAAQTRTLQPDQRVTEKTLPGRTKVIRSDKRRPSKIEDNTLKIQIHPTPINLMQITSVCILSFIGKSANFPSARWAQIRSLKIGRKACDLQSGQDRQPWMPFQMFWFAIPLCFDNHNTVPRRLVLKSTRCSCWWTSDCLTEVSNCRF